MLWKISSRYFIHNQKKQKVEKCNIIKEIYQVNENDSLDFPSGHWESVYEHRSEENSTKLPQNNLAPYAQACQPLKLLSINVGETENYIDNWRLTSWPLSIKPPKIIEAIII